MEKMQIRHAVCLISAPLIKQSRGVEELQFYFFSRTAREALRQILSYYPTLNAAYSSSYVEIFSAEASKGKALSALSQHLHLDRSQIACIGDSENDLSMFEAVGHTLCRGQRDRCAETASRSCAARPRS